MRIPVTVLLAATWLALILPDRLGAHSSGLLGASLAIALVALDAWPVRLLGTWSGSGFFTALCAGVTSYPLVLLMSRFSTALVSSIESPAHRLSPQDWASAITAICLAPVFEEYVFRGRVLDHLGLRLGVAPAVVISAVLFSAFHDSPTLLLGTFLAGLVLGVLRIATGSLGPCIAYHSGLNIAVLWAVAVPSPGPVLAVALTCVSLLCLLLTLKRVQWKSNDGIESMT